VIKLTDLKGRAFWVRQTAITAIREPVPGEFEGDAKAVIYCGGQTFAVKESIALLAQQLGA
jgi:uncharacterized protein YlzI (FlbEa/FlbD family)